MRRKQLRARGDGAAESLIHDRSWAGVHGTPEEATRAENERRAGQIHSAGSTTRSRLKVRIRFVEAFRFASAGSQSSSDVDTAAEATNQQSAPRTRGYSLWIIPTFLIREATT